MFTSKKHMYENAFDGKDVQVFNIKLKEPCKPMQNPKHHVTEKNEDEHAQQTYAFSALQGIWLATISHSAKVTKRRGYMNVNQFI